MQTRRRLPAQVRRGQIIEAAALLAVRQGYLPVSPEALAGAVGVSKALIYRHFPNQHDLFNAVLARAFEALEAGDLPSASSRGDLATAAHDCALIYFAHVGQHGPIAHVILRDRFMAGRVASAQAGFRDRIARRLIRLIRRELGLSAQEATGAFNLALTIPEEAGRLVWQGTLGPDDGAALCARLIQASIDGLAKA